MALVIGLVVFGLLVSPLGGWPALAVGIAAAVLFHQTIGKARREAREERRRQYEERVRGIVQAHLPALLRRKRQLDRTDDYGVRDDGKWVKEINRFCDTVVCPAIGQVPLQMPRDMKSQPRRFQLDNLIAALVDQAVTEQASSFTQRFDPGMTPTDYEHFCADRLKLSG